MNRTLLLISAVLLSAIAGVQTAMAQKVTLYSAGSKAYECDIAQLDSIVFSEGQTIIPDEEIIVTVDANGNVDGEHQFTRIDETTFLIDGLKYKFENGGLSVIGYDPVFFTGTAKVISKLIYNGRSMDVVGIGGSAFENCSILTSITIPNSVTSIGEEAFTGCWSLASVTIPNSVTSIGNFTFRRCISLTSITIPGSVTSIGNGVFSGCSGLTSITIPNSVTNIGNYVFQDCSSLTSITIPESVTSIGISVFDRCTSLTSITIPNSVTSIGYWAFCYCTSLTDVYCYAENVPSTSSVAFENSSFSSATLHVPAGSVGAYKAKAPWKSFGTIVAIE